MNDNYEKLSQESKDTLIGMVEFCINKKYCMGMDEGIKNFKTGEEHDFVTELRNFIKSHN